VALRKDVAGGVGFMTVDDTEELVLDEKDFAMSYQVR
jgi:hypothetical protein